MFKTPLLFSLSFSTRDQLPGSPSRRDLGHLTRSLCTNSFARIAVPLSYLVFPFMACKVFRHLLQMQIRQTPEESPPLAPYSQPVRAEQSRRDDNK